ncbi:MAG: hypothetical protein IT383_08185 [Deltaproteobacteria bacterium]|nr:hypothetical protein [Deltaproteobacteria bacterium]
MGTERVVKLLRGHRVRIARALVRQSRALAPRYEQLDSTAQERSFLTLILATERLLDRGDDAPLLDAAGHLAEMRAAMGFGVDDFALAALGFLPVMRRFIIENARSTDEGLDDYEAFESIALPLIGRAATIFLEATEDPTMPNQQRSTLATLKRPAPVSGIARLRIERVTGTDEEEAELRNHPLFSAVG